MSQKLSMRDILDGYLKPSTSSNPDPGTSSEIGTTKRGPFYSVIRNIPSSFRSKHLRYYFSDYVDNSRFDCFHFRHRVEVQQQSTHNDSTKKGTNCCVIRFSNEENRSDFIKDYHGRRWMDETGMEMPRRCFVTAIKVIMKSVDSSSDSLTENDLISLIELRPPAAMPHGNVGTSSAYFLEQISQCKLPGSLIAKLGLKTGRRRRKFEAVPFQYEGVIERGSKLVTKQDGTDELRRRNTQLKDSQRNTELQKETEMHEDPTNIAVSRNVPDNDEGADNDNDECEEWERHEALHDDVTEHERTKERKFEEEMEVVWEKGGPGLVWQMDKEYWDEREKGTDMDWRWADDWDVDYSVYYEGKSAGTRDAIDAVEMREDEARRSGKLEESAFRRPHAKAIKRKRRHSGSEIADINKYSNPMASAVMKKMGWTPGSGLGRGSAGRVNPVAFQMEEDALVGREKTGLGYRGDRLQRTGFVKPNARRDIVSVFDTYADREAVHDAVRRVDDTKDPSSEVLWRRKEPTFMKHN